MPIAKRYDYIMAVYNAVNNTPKNAGGIRTELSFCWKSTKDALILLEALGAIRRVDIGRRKFYIKKDERLIEENRLLKGRNMRLEKARDNIVACLKKSEQDL